MTEQDKLIDSTMNDLKSASTTDADKQEGGNHYSSGYDSGSGPISPSTNESNSPQIIDNCCETVVNNNDEERLASNKLPLTNSADINDTSTKNPKKKFPILIPSKKVKKMTPKDSSSTSTSTPSSSSTTITITTPIKNKEPGADDASCSSSENEASNIPLSQRLTTITKKKKKNLIRFRLQQSKADRDILNEMRNPKASTSGPLLREMERFRRARETGISALDTNNKLTPTTFRRITPRRRIPTSGPNRGHSPLKLPAKLDSPIKKKKKIIPVLKKPGAKKLKSEDEDEEVNVVGDKMNFKNDGNNIEEAKEEQTTEEEPDNIILITPTSYDYKVKIETGEETQKNQQEEEEMEKTEMKQEKVSTEEVSFLSESSEMTENNDDDDTVSSTTDTTSTSAPTEPSQKSDNDIKITVLKSVVSIRLERLDESFINSFNKKITKNVSSTLQKTTTIETKASSVPIKKYKGKINTSTNLKKSSKISPVDVDKAVVLNKSKVIHLDEVLTNNNTECSTKTSSAWFNGPTTAPKKLEQVERNSSTCSSLREKRGSNKRKAFPFTDQHQDQDDSELDEEVDVVGCSEDEIDAVVESKDVEDMIVDIESTDDNDNKEVCATADTTQKSKLPQMSNNNRPKRTKTTSSNNNNNQAEKNTINTTNTRALIIGKSTLPTKSNKNNAVAVINNNTLIEDPEHQHSVKITVNKAVNGMTTPQSNDHCVPVRRTSTRKKKLNSHYAYLSWW